MIKKDWASMEGGSGGYSNAFISMIHMYPFCNSFLSTIYVSLLLNAVHLAFGALRLI